MKRIFLLFLLIFSSCPIDFTENSNCGEWEFSDNVPQGGSFGGVRWECRSVLEQFGGRWEGQIDTVLESGEIYSQEVCSASSLLIDDSTIRLSIPLIDDGYLQEYGTYPKYELVLDFINWNKGGGSGSSGTFEFVVDSNVFDPFVQNTVSYYGSGQINNFNQINPSLEFSFEYVFEGATYTTYFEGCKTICFC
jgi:hypothetical protein